MIARAFSRALLLSAFAALAAFEASSTTLPTQAHSASKQARAAGRSRSVAGYGKLPLSFEANTGQAAPEIKFLSRGKDYELYLTAQEAVLSLNHNSCASVAHTPQTKRSDSRDSSCALASVTVRMSVAGQPNAAAVTAGQDPLPGTANYFIGNDPAQWRTGVPTYAKVRYASIYPGIDLLYYGNQRQLEYDFIVAPGADPEDIQLHFAGLEKLSITPHGDLVFSSKQGQIAFHKPTVYQLSQGQRNRHSIPGRFRLIAGNTVGFALGRYDHSQPLIIDPVLAYSTFLGGASTGGDFATAIAVDASGSAYVTGQANSANFPVTSGAYQLTNAAAASSTFNAFITKLNPAGSALVYSTYIGGSLNTRANAIALDNTGNAYITGSTFAANFPTTTGAFQTVSKASASGYTAFVAKLNAMGTALVYSTYLGGSGNASGTGDMGNGISVDTSGGTYIAGTTYSADFPATSGAFQTANTAAINNSYDAFVTKLNATGTALTYSTLLGGSGTGLNGQGDAAYSLAVDASGDAYVTGAAASANFPTTAGAYQVASLSSPLTQTSVFVTKLNPAGSAPVYSTFIGGTSNSGGYALAIDASGNAYVTGAATSSDFPTTPGVFQSVNNAAAISVSNAFVLKLNPTGSALVYSTWLGGSGLQKSFFFKSGDSADSLAVDSTGNAYVAGTAFSTNFPVTTGAFQTTNFAATDKTSNAFFTELNSTATALVYSTYIGGAGAPVGTSGNYAGDAATGLALDSASGVYIAGLANSTNYPVTVGAFQVSNKAAANTASNAFITKFSSAINTTTALAASANPQNAGTSVTFTATVAAASGSSVPTGSIVFLVDSSNVATVSLNTSAQATYSTSTLTAGTHTLTAIYLGNTNFGGSTSANLSETINAATTQTSAPIFSPAAGTYASAQSITLSDATSGAAIYYTTDGTSPTTASTKYTAAIPVSKTTTVKAIAVATGDANSVVASVTYTITASPTAATPTLTPANGIYTSAQSVTIADATAGAIIYYTTSGATPTISSPKYTRALTVSKTTTVKAMAVATGYTNSAVASATYTIAVAPSVTSKAATGQTTSGARLNGTVTANNATTKYWFAYGTSTASLTSTTTKTGALTGTAATSVFATLTGLKTKTKYYFKAMASNSVGTTSGAILSFTTN